MIQLYLEYNPQPPFNAGSPEGAGPDLVAKAKKMAEASLARRAKLIDEVASRQRASMS